jgi:hypothetical protein
LSPFDAYPPNEIPVPPPILQEGAPDEMTPMAPPPPPPPEEIPAPEPSKKFQDEAFEYIGRWCRHSADYVDTKKETWKLLEDLFENKRPLSCWNTKTSDLPGRMQKILEGWREENSIAISPIVMAYAHRAYQKIFSNDEFFRITARPVCWSNRSIRASLCHFKKDRGTSKRRV